MARWNGEVKGVILPHWSKANAVVEMNAYQIFKFKKDVIFIADAAYDVREVYSLIVNTMKGQAFIPLNPRNRQPDKTFGHHGCPLCDAGLEMKSAGSWTEWQRTRLKFRCPLKADSKVSANYPKGCLIQHPRLTLLSQFEGYATR